MNRKIHKIISILCSVALLISIIDLPILANNVTQNSTPSTNTNISDGEDFTQGEKTIYNNGTTLDASESTEVYVSQSSTFAAMIPKVIILDGHGGNATYEVYAKGNIGGTENVYIIPQDTFQLNDVKNIKSSLNGTIVQTKTTFSWNDVMNEQKSKSIGNILVNGISAGNWSGSFNFNIYLKDTSTHIESITLVDESVINKETNAIQIQSSSNKEIPISIYPASNVDTLEVSSDSPYVSATLEEIEVSPIASANNFFDSLLLTNNVFAENETSKNVKLKVQVSENAPCNLNATITIKSRAKILEIPIFVEHSYDNGTYTWSSDKTSCTASRICSTCGNVENETKTSTSAITTNATCTTSGTRTYISDFVNSAFATQTTTSSIAALGHTYDSGLITIMPTGDDVGVKTFTCSICNKIDTQEIPALGYSDFILSASNYTMANIDIMSNNVTIPEKFVYNGVYYKTVGIDNNTFKNKTTLISITIPSSVTSIGNYAFTGCSGLTGNLTIPSSVTSIGNYAFSGCSGLTGNLTIPSSVTSIGNYAFYGCSGLTGNLTIPSSVTSIGNYAFYGCSGLTSVTIPNSVTSIVSAAFYNCSGLTSVTIPSSVTSIGDNAFSGCSGLTSVTIPNSVTSIGNSAFDGCSGLTGNLTIPNSVTSIGSLAFYKCSGLTGNLTIPNSVTSIGSLAFTSCSGLTSITIPSSVTSIENSTFSSCSGLTSITIPSSVTKIGSSAFYKCSGLTSITIPSSVTSIGDSAFSGCSGLTSITIPNSVKSIGNYAFYGCSGLTSITIPNSVTTIGTYVFTNCTKLTSITYNGVVYTSISTFKTAFNKISGNLMS